MKGIKLTVITCQDCGVEVVAKNPSRKRCPECAAKKAKEQRVEAKKRWEADKERYNAYQRGYLRRKALEEPEKFKARNKKNYETKKLQREESPEKAQAYKVTMANYYQENKQELTAKNKQWVVDHPEEYRLSRNQRNHNRRARVRQVGGKWKYKELVELCEIYDNHCCYCHKQLDRLTADHMIPISRNGANTMDNIIPSCLSCNSSKHDKTLLEFAPIMVRMNPF